MNLDTIEAFLAVTDMGSFSLAAEQLHITQPAISKRIKQLEEQLQSQLFERGNKQLLLSHAGRQLLPHARAILLEVKNAKEAIELLNDTVSGPLGIAVSHHVGLHRLPLILRRFIQKYPQVDLQLRFLESEKAINELAVNGCDLAFITLPPVLSDELNLHLKWRDPMRFVCAPDHPLSKESQVTMEQLATFQAVLPASTTTTFQLIKHLFETHALTLKASIPTNDLETIKMMVSVGIGWSVLPETMLDGNVQQLVTKVNTPYRHLGAVSIKRKKPGKAALAFIEEAQAVWGKD